LRRIGVTAAAIVLVLAFGALAVRAANGPSGPMTHSCTATNQSFIQTATIDVSGMFSEYGSAVGLIGKGKDGSARMQRAYGLANFAREILAEAQPALQEKGCDVGPLL
jgi:hypothetical protein